MRSRQSRCRWPACGRSKNCAGIVSRRSESGIGFSGEKLFPGGTTLEIEFRIGSAHAEWFKVKGVVRHTQNGQMGVEFIEMSESVKLRIRKVVFHELAIQQLG